MEKTLENTVAEAQPQAKAKGDNAADKGPQMQLIVFKLGKEEYGMNIDQIKEVVLTPHVSAVPLAKPYVRGVGNIRGNILAIVDLEERFGLKSSTRSGQGNYTLVVESADLSMGILVKEVPNTLSISESEIDDSPGILQEEGAQGNYITGIAKAGDRLIILIDIFRIINEEELAGLMSNA